MSDETYCYPPDFSVLKNKFGLRNSQSLDTTEREFASLRMKQGCPSGDFDLPHLQAIHRHLFQDVYDWAGETRSLEISKGGSQFLPRQFIGNGMNDVHSRIVAMDYLKGMDAAEFSKNAGELIGDINHIHPFREGNGRTQMQYLKLLSENAGHDIDLTKIDPKQWMQASIRSHHADYTLMQDCIFGAITKDDAQAIIEKGSQSNGPQISESDYAKALRQAQNQTASLTQDKEQDLE